MIKSFQSVLDRLLRGLNDGNLTNADAEEVMHAVAELTLGMRCDMLDEIGSAEKMRRTGTDPPELSADGTAR